MNWRVLGMAVVAAAVVLVSSLACGDGGQPQAEGTPQATVTPGAWAATAKILKTTDGGSTWTIHAPDSARHLVSVEFPLDAATGYAVAAGGAAESQSQTGGP